MISPCIWIRDSTNQEERALEDSSRIAGGSFSRPFCLSVEDLKHLDVHEASGLKVKAQVFTVADRAPCSACPRYTPVCLGPTRPPRASALTVPAASPGWAILSTTHRMATPPHPRASLPVLHRLSPVLPRAPLIDCWPSPFPPASADFLLPVRAPVRPLGTACTMECQPSRAGRSWAIPTLYLIIRVMFGGHKSDFDIGQELHGADFFIKCLSCSVSESEPEHLPSFSPRCFHISHWSWFWGYWV